MHFHACFLRFLCLISLLLLLLSLLGRLILSASEDVVVGLILVGARSNDWLRFFFISSKDIAGLLGMMRALLVLRLFNVSVEDVALRLLVNLH